MQYPGTNLRLVLVGMLIMGSAWCFGQAIPDGDFENWTDQGSFEEPASEWWASLNDLVLLGSPATVEKSNDAHSGDFSAKLTTKQWFSTLLPGLLVAGNFDSNNSSFLVQGRPWVSRPEVFSGWYKYSPVNGDSAAIAVYFTKWNGSSRDTVGEATFAEYDTVDVWTQWTLPVIYGDTATPDSIFLALVSSAGGQNFQGQAGSTLWIDDLALESATAQPEISRQAQIEVFPNPVGDVLYMRNLPVGVDVALLNEQGIEVIRFIPAMDRAQFDVTSLPQGIYMLRVRPRKGAILIRRILVGGN